LRKKGEGRNKGGEIIFFTVSDLGGLDGQVVASRGRRKPRGRGEKGKIAIGGGEKNQNQSGEVGMSRSRISRDLTVSMSWYGAEGGKGKKKGK